MIQDENLMEAISELLLTLQEAAMQLLDFVDIVDAEKFDIVAEDILTGIRQIGEISAPFKRQDENIRLTDACKCAFDSLKRIIQYRQNGDWDKAGHKIEFEFFPILEVAYIKFRYWGCAYPDQEKIEQFKANELANFTMNRYVEQAEQIGEYKYELSIGIVAYNKLEYTKQCVESLLRYLPNDLSYELILFNHGSTDGTKEYFEEIKPDKQLDISVNGAVLEVLYKVIEGEFYLGISNDVIITEKAISNLLSCIKEDSKIAWVVPTTPNVSNLQSIPSDYHNLLEMHSFAAENNHYDISRHEQRVRLCDPIAMARSAMLCKVKKELYISIHCSNNVQSFPDDKHSLAFRRSGYKLILAKDAYCYHFGSVTLKDEITIKNEQQFYLQGRQNFIKEFGIDPWGIGFCFDPQLISKLSCQDMDSVNILGIDCGLGSNPLKIKETIKENTGNQAVTICNYINDKRYVEDLKSVSDQVVVYQKQKDLQEVIAQVPFRYIVIESGLEQQMQPLLWLKTLIRELLEGSSLCVKVDNQDLRIGLKHKLKQVQLAGSWLIITK